MFVENLKKEDREKFVQNIMLKVQKLGAYSRKSVYAYVKKDKLYVVFGGKGKIDFQLEVSDTFTTYSTKFKAIDNIENLSKVCTKELYKIFGEEYKDYYMQQANSIFTN